MAIHSVGWVYAGCAVNEKPRELRKKAEIKYGSHNL